MDKCILCNNDVEESGETVELRQKGADSINKASKLRGDEIEAKHGIVVHKSCTLEYTNTKSIDLFKRKDGESAADPKRLLLHLTSKQIVFSVVNQLSQSDIMTKVNCLV